jgi:hypothetical protein
VDPEGCIYSDPGHEQQLSLGPFGLAPNPRKSSGDVSTPGESGDTSPNPGQLLASALPCGPPYDVIPRRHPEMNHGVQCGQTAWILRGAIIGFAAPTCRFVIPASCCLAAAE